VAPSDLWAMAIGKHRDRSLESCHQRTVIIAIPRHVAGEEGAGWGVVRAPMLLFPDYSPKHTRSALVHRDGGDGRRPSLESADAVLLSVNRAYRAFFRAMPGSCPSLSSVTLYMSQSDSGIEQAGGNSRSMY